MRLEYEACLTKLKVDSQSKDSAIQALKYNLSAETSQNKTLLIKMKEELNATKDLEKKKKKLKLKMKLFLGKFDLSSN